MMVRVDKKQLQRQFGRAAHRYDQYAQMQHDIATRLAEYLPELPEQNLTIADLGCGTGVGVKLLLERYTDASVLGVDIANEMLQVARLSYPQASFLNQDLEELSLPSESADLLFSSSAIQWCDAQRVLAECFRVLKPGGQLLFSTFLNGTLSGWRELWMSEQQIQQHRFLNTTVLLQLLNEVGFAVLAHDQELIEQQFSSFEQAAESIKVLGAGNAVKSAKTGLMGKQKYLHLKTKAEQRLSDGETIKLGYKVAYFVVSKGY